MWIPFLKGEFAEGVIYDFDVGRAIGSRGRFRVQIRYVIRKW